MIINLPDIESGSYAADLMETSALKMFQRLNESQREHLAIVTARARARQEYVGHEAGFDTDWTRQDAAVLNLIRACEQAIDMANRMSLVRGLPIADSTGDTFTELGKAGLIPGDLARSMKRTVGRWIERRENPDRLDEQGAQPGEALVRSAPKQPPLDEGDGDARCLVLQQSEILDRARDGFEGSIVQAGHDVPEIGAGKAFEHERGKQGVEVRVEDLRQRHSHGAQQRVHLECVGHDLPHRGRGHPKHDQGTGFQAQVEDPVAASGREARNRSRFGSKKPQSRLAGSSGIWHPSIASGAHPAHSPNAASRPP